MASQDTSNRIPAMSSRPFCHGEEPANAGNLPNRQDHRLDRLIEQLPDRWRRAVQWLRRPAARWARIPAGVFFIIGGVLAVLPILGLWMIPIGVILLAEDIPALRRLRDRVLDWLERRRPHWFFRDDE